MQDSELRIKRYRDARCSDSHVIWKAFLERSKGVDCFLALFNIDTKDYGCYAPLWTHAAAIERLHTAEGPFPEMTLRIRNAN